MATPITRQILMQGLTEIFDEAYESYAKDMVQLVYIKRGRYEVWKGSRRLAKRIRHRKEALALIKLIRGNEE